MKRPNRRQLLLFGALGLLAPVLLLAVLTQVAMRPLPALPDSTTAGRRVQLLDRRGEPLSVTYDNRWNLTDIVALHEVPSLLRAAFVQAEDRRFFEHNGVDWRSRLHALVQNIRAGRAVRGASTISEQSVRILHTRPRPRKLWSRWLEGFEANTLDAKYSKGEILEFYLNQVPYARQRRGVVQAAREYFDRDLETLSAREMLALAVLVRSPSRLDLRRESAGPAMEAGIERLARRLLQHGDLSSADFKQVLSERLVLREPSLTIQAPHFVRYVRDLDASLGSRRAGLRTTVEGSLQRRIESVLEHRLHALTARGVTDGAVLVVDHRTNEILAWVNAGGFSTDHEGSQIDAVLALRQPGSTLKPFLYALALEQGWTAATLIDDSPFSGAVGAGLHRVRNYSRLHHGRLRLREALGNSLNVPAVRTIRTVTPQAFHQTLLALGFSSLDQHPDIYGEGLALGNGEVSLYELVRAYAALARGGRWESLQPLTDAVAPIEGPRRIFSTEIASLIADILSDSGARSLEFGSGGILDLPVQTAVKTGTSNDYRDAWALGFSDQHTVGVWMGDMGRREMDGVSGSIGPAIVLRAVFAELRKGEESAPLFLSRKLRRVTICRESGMFALPKCPKIEEWFRPEHRPEGTCPIHDGSFAVTAVASTNEPTFAQLIQPVRGLHLAMDPRIPDEIEAFAFEVETQRDPVKIEWFVDNQLVGTTAEKRFNWNLSRGAHTAYALLWSVDSNAPVETGSVPFLVK